MTKEQFKTIMMAVFSSSLDVMEAVSLAGGVEYNDVVEVTQGIFKVLYEGGQEATKIIEKLKN